jgi:hypothetical protein
MILHFFGYTTLPYYLKKKCYSLYVTNYIYTQMTTKYVVLSTFVMSKMMSFWLFHTK